MHPVLLSLIASWLLVYGLGGIAAALYTRSLSTSLIWWLGLPLGLGSDRRSTKILSLAILGLIVFLWLALAAVIYWMASTT